MIDIYILRWEKKILLFLFSRNTSWILNKPDDQCLTLCVSGTSKSIKSATELIPSGDSQQNRRVYHNFLYSNICLFIALLSIKNFKGFFPLILLQEEKKRYRYLTPHKSPGPIIQTSKPLFVASWRTTVKWSLLFRIISSICCASRPVCSGAWQRDGRQGRLETLPSWWLVARPPPSSLPRPWSPWHPHRAVFYLFIHTSGRNRGACVLICMKWS